MHRGVEYIEDGNAAIQLQIEELEAFKESKIQQLVEKRDRLLAVQTAAEQEGKIVNNFAEQNRLLTKAIADEKAKSLEAYASELKIPVDKIRLKSGANKISPADLKNIKKAQPLGSFTEIEMKKINEHHGKLELNLQKLMDAAMGDEHFNYELMCNPVFLRDGHVYDRGELKKFLASKNGKAICPNNQDISFTEADLIPCNTLIQAIQQLLVIIETEGKVGPVIPKPKYATLEQKTDRQRIPQQLIPIIDKFYSAMPDKHKVLFDIVCRDPVCGHIMDDPVFLPDGFVYDRTIALFMLRKKMVFVVKIPIFDLRKKI